MLRAPAFQELLSWVKEKQWSTREGGGRVGVGEGGGGGEDEAHFRGKVLEAGLALLP